MAAAPMDMRDCEPWTMANAKAPHSQTQPARSDFSRQLTARYDKQCRPSVTLDDPQTMAAGLKAERVVALPLALASDMNKGIVDHEVLRPCPKWQQTRLSVA